MLITTTMQMTKIDTVSVKDVIGNSQGSSLSIAASSLPLIFKKS